MVSKTQEPDRNRYSQALRRLRGALLLAIVFSAGVNLLMLTGPMFMLQVYDRVLASGSVPTLVGLSVVVVVLFAFMALYDFLRVRLLSRAGYHLDRDLGDAGFDEWLASGVRGNRLNRRPLADIAVLRGFLASPAMLGIFDLPWVPFYLAVVFYIHPWLGFLTLGGAVIVTIAALAGQWLTEPGYKRAMGMDAGESFFVEQAYRNAEPVLALGMADRVRSRWRRMHDDGLASGQQAGDWSEGLSAFSKSFRLLLQSAMLALGAYLAIYQSISAGMIVATSIIAGRALAPIDQVIGQWRSVVRAREAHHRLAEVLAAPPPPRTAVALPAPEGHLAVNALTKFAPGQTLRADRPPILSQVSFALSPGDALGVIGPSASGKSTLARLLVGAWQADSGEIRLDGATYDQWDPISLGPHIGYLPQSLELLSGTVRDNICRFDPQGQDDAIIAAARLAGVHDMILSLPKGYATEIGHGTPPLSGGQVQRVGLARALYGNPRLIVLDEPNANLDAIGDDALMRAIMACRERGATLVVMAHRPSALASVNKVLVLQNGTVAHFGDKDSVLAQAVRPAATLVKRVQDAG
ncbi:MAG: type I secretion system permease/ATPase [Rhodobacteraceae bacterium]|nr:type I secretion system permease/ATPase [Paracoccaceae bacterium]